MQTLTKKAVGNITKAVNDSIAKGWKMSKMTRPPISTMFSYQPPLYIEKTVYTREQLFKLSDEGFKLDEDESAGLFALNILLNL